MRSGALLVAFEADAGFDDVLLMVLELEVRRLLFGHGVERCSAHKLFGPSRCGKHWR